MHLLVAQEVLCQHLVSAVVQVVLLAGVQVEIQTSVVQAVEDLAVVGVLESH